ncbi:MAG: hypothetical protein FJ086_07075 [Deltaproteobacteria bacterium]|nr:hypothetical protein [Deltaproteobacteria bacterium]
MTALLLPVVLTLSLADAPRAAGLLQAEAMAQAGESEATPIVESEPLDATGPTPRPRPLLEEVAPGRVALGLVAGSAAVVVSPVVTVLALLQVPSMERALASGALSAELAALVLGPLLASWVMGPLAAGLVMGAGPVQEKAVVYALAGALFGLMSVTVPVVGVLALFAGPMLGTVHALATSPADLWLPAAPPPGAPLLTLNF